MSKACIACGGMGWLGGVGDAASPCSVCNVGGDGKPPEPPKPGSPWVTVTVVDDDTATRSPAESGQRPEDIFSEQQISAAAASARGPRS